MKTTSRVQHAGHPYRLSRRDWNIGISIEPDEQTEIQDTWFGTIKDGRTGIDHRTAEFIPSPRPKTTGIVIILGSCLGHIPMVRLEPNYTIRDKILAKKHEWNQDEYMGTIEIWQLTGILDLDEIDV